MAFEKGDVVRLKSGGPDMVVQDIGNYEPMGPEDGVKCVWFDGKKQSEHVFDAATLAKAPTGYGPVVV